MELWILVALSGPVFYITGLIVFIRWMVRGGRSAEEDAKAKAAQQVRDEAMGADPNVAKALLDVADRLGGTVTLGNGPVVRGNGPEGIMRRPDTPAGKPHASTVFGNGVDGKPAMQSLDNINLILYLGAFLVVVSAGIFVGYNFSVLSGFVKTLFLALFALAFYGVGLVLFLYFKKLRPAGVTFTGIGLVLFPLVGLAAFNFMDLQGHGGVVWFTTSLLTLIAYVATLYITRQTYVAYLMAFTTLSLFESSVSLFDLSVYWYGWAMAGVSILLLSLSGTKQLWKDTATALKLSANIFLPVSLVLSIFAVPPHGLTQLGVTIALAGVFYAAMAGRSENQPAGEGYWAAALLCFPAALTIGLWDTFPRLTLAAILLGVCLLYLAGIHLAGRKLGHRWLLILAAITGLMPFGGVALAAHRPWAVAVILVAAVLINAELALKLRQTGLALVASFSLIALPFVALEWAMVPSRPLWQLAVALLVVAAALVWWARRIKDWPESGAAVGTMGYMLAIVAAIVVAAISSPTALFWIGALAATGVYILSWSERRPEFIYVAVAILYLALFQPAAMFHQDSLLTALLLLAAGAAIYGLAALDADPQRAAAARYSGLAGPFIGAASGIFDFNRVSDAPNFGPVIALGTGAVLVWLEGRRRDFAELQEAGGAILLVAVNWYCGLLKIDQTQVYTIPWAAFLGVLAWRRRDRGHESYDGFTVAALAVLTFPLATQALADDGQFYGLALILESLALVFIGMIMRYKIITIWGAATLVLEVLYQMRDFFYALPKYFISAALGLALLAVAIVMLQRRKGGD